VYKRQTSYKATVTAIGDGTNYVDSAESVAVSVSTASAAATPVIGTQPTATVSKSVGATYTVSVVATTSDSGTLSYQWFKDGVAISGATSATYSVTTTSGSAGSYTVAVTNTANGSSASVTSNASVLTMFTAPTISTPTLGARSGTAGVAFSLTLSASGGSGTYSSWSVRAGTLPNGLTLNTSTGIISGTSSVAGTFNVSIDITDSVGGGGSIALALVMAKGTLASPVLTTSKGTFGTTNSIDIAWGAVPYAARYSITVYNIAITTTYCILSTTGTSLTVSKANGCLLELPANTPFRFIIAPVATDSNSFNGTDIRPQISTNATPVLARNLTLGAKNVTITGSNLTWTLNYNNTDTSGMTLQIDWYYQGTLISGASTSVDVTADSACLLYTSPSPRD
jgi:hypothetical protein